MPAKKRTRAEYDSETKQALADADKEASAAPVERTPEEDRALNEYLGLLVLQKQSEAETREKVKGNKTIVSRLRALVLEGIKRDAEHVGIMAIPLEMRKDADERLIAAGLPPVPPYMRLVRNTKDLAITPDLVKDIIDKLTPDDIEEAGTDDGIEALVLAVMAAVRRSVRSYSEQVKLMESVPRGTRAADVPAAPRRLAEAAIELHERGAVVLAEERAKREAVAGIKARMPTPLATVDSLFKRAKWPRASVGVGGQPFWLCRREYTVKPKVTFKLLQGMVSVGAREALERVVRRGAGKLSKAAVAAAIVGPQRRELQMLLQLKMSGLESTTRVSYHLQRKEEQAEAEQHEDDESGSDSE